MTDKTSEHDSNAGNAADRSDKSDTSTRPSGHTGAGQEATHGTAPAQHDTEHKSKYGGEQDAPRRQP